MWQEEQFVCVNCFEEPGLVRFIKANAVSNECSFCTSTDSTPVAALIGEVAEHFLGCLFTEYNLAGNELGWDDSEGGWQGIYWDTDDLLFHELEIDFPQDNRDLLLPLLFGEHWGQDWCEANAYGLNDRQVARFSWARFREVTMHQRRFFFLDYRRESYDPEVYSPNEVLHTIFEYAQETALFRQMPAGTQLFRARWEGQRPYLKAPDELGPPPKDKAIQSNRMSPAGVPMFYASDHEDTALRETAIGPGYFAVGRFETLRPATLLDLTEIPPVPSLFDPVPDSTEIPPRRLLTFLHHVAEQFSVPIKRDDRVHVEYVPTQIVTEFVRSQLTWESSGVDGIKYFSAARPGHVSYVLFADEGNVVSTPASRYSDDKWLRLIHVNHTWVSEDETHS